MNSLQAFLAKSGYTDSAAMNELQLEGIVSDLCLSSADVPESDCAKAIEFLTPFQQPIAK